MDSKRFRNLLDRYQNKSANEVESALVDAWYKSYETKEDLILIDQTAKEMAKANLDSKFILNTPENIFRIKPILSYLKFAAAIFLIFGLAFLLYDHNKPTKREHAQYYAIKTGTGTYKKLVLPDGSIMWMNSASKVRVPKTFQGTTREVFLDEGEAFFKVQKNHKRPFIVHASTLDVKVLGTSFNIRSYSKLLMQKVFVKTGKVIVSHGTKLLGALRPGDQISYDIKTTETKLNHSNADHLANWMEGSTYLDQVSFEELAMVLENTYDLKLKAGSIKVRDYQYTLMINSSQPLDRTLSMISMIHNTNYRKEGNNITIY